ncbi:hypothetical protein M9Y10_001785 [Tritrichomonas musculus]|uniref:Uncharacterized protein n=1 Tax=Tritrichomonas musculus TaxID=1915356 RepID=A0ABR2L7Y2_9EUKA
MSSNQNNSVSSYVRLQLDDSFIDKCFQHVNKKLNRHEELINELMRLLKNKADLSDLENLRVSLLDCMDEKINEKIDDRLSEFELRFNEKLNQTKSDLLSNLNNSIEKVVSSFDEKLKEINDKLNQLEKLSDFGKNIQQQFDEMKDRVETIEKKLDREVNVTQNHQKSINSIILSFGGLNEQDLSKNLLNDFSGSKKNQKNLLPKNDLMKTGNTDENPNEDENVNSDENIDNNLNLNKNEKTDIINNLHNSDLTKALTSSTIYVNDELKSLRDELQKVKDEIQIQSIMGKQPPKTEQQSPPPIVIPSSPKNKVSPQPSPKSPVIQKSQNTKIIKMKDTSNNNWNDFINSHNFIDFDFLSCQPRNIPIVHWADPPELPKIEQFRDMYGFVDYFYRFVPKLQAHLTAIHQKVVENSSEIIGKCDKGLVEKMFDKFQAIVNEMRKRLNDLKEAVEQTASREEINQMVNELLMRLGSDSETAAGCVKCIACGREVAIVTGARNEKEFNRILGEPPNSIARSNTLRSSSSALPASAGIGVCVSRNFGNNTSKSNGIKVTYSNRDGFDSEIVESPRSIRPAKMKVPR